MSPQLPLPEKSPVARGLVWLASYPKSGNTWMRAFLTNYQRNSDQPADINEMDGGPIASARELFDDEVGVEASDLTLDEIDRLRPLVYTQYARSLKTLEFLKIHDAYILTSRGAPMIPPQATYATLYILRNPLDVAISYAHHSHCTVDEAIQFMAEDDHALVGSKRRLHNQLRQILLTWSGHVLSWVDAPGMNVMVVRYEELQRDPTAAFGAVVRFLGLPEEPARLQRAIAFSSFDTLKQQEQEHGFREKMPLAESFFRQGRSGGWRATLSPGQVQAIIAAHGAVMQRFGYLDDAGQPV
jgi:hypothetical protein